MTRIELFSRYFVTIRINTKVKASWERGPEGPSRTQMFINRNMGPRAPLPALRRNKKEGTRRLSEPYT